MRIKAALAGAAMMLAAAVPAAAEAANAITSATVNFRASPGGAVLGAVPNGSPVTVVGQSGNWCQTEWGGYIGWVHCRYVQAAVVQAPRYVPGPYYPHGFFGPTIGFGFGFGIDRDFHHRHRSHRFGGRRFDGHGGFHARGGGGAGMGSRSTAAELRNR